jgi:C4-dicarboxylate transporter, DctQ subunit
MTPLSRLNAWLWAAARASIGLVLIAATALVFVNVFLRYVFNYALSWGDEVITYSLLWLVFLGGGVAARQGAHISMEAVLTLLPARMQRHNAMLVNVVCAGLCAVVGYLGWSLAVAVRNFDQVGAASGVPMFWVYLAIPAGCALMMLGFFEVALRHLRGPERPQAADGADAKNLAAPG